MEEKGGHFIQSLALALATFALLFFFLGKAILFVGPSAGRMAHRSAVRKRRRGAGSGSHAAAKATGGPPKQARAPVPAPMPPKAAGEAAPASHRCRLPLRSPRLPRRRLSRRRLLRPLSSHRTELATRRVAATRRPKERVRLGGGSGTPGAGTVGVSGSPFLGGGSGAGTVPSRAARPRYRLSPRCRHQPRPLREITAAYPSIREKARPGRPGENPG